MVLTLFKFFSLIQFYTFDFMTVYRVNRVGCFDCMGFRAKRFTLPNGKHTAETLIVPEATLLFLRRGQS